MAETRNPNFQYRANDPLMAGLTQDEAYEVWIEDEYGDPFHARAKRRLFKQAKKGDRTGCPYPWCPQPGICKRPEVGACPKDPNCGE
jgi:hypothetical protein